MSCRNCGQPVTEHNTLSGLSLVHEKTGRYVCTSGRAVAQRPFVAVGQHVYDPDWEPVEVMSWDRYEPVL